MPALRRFPIALLLLLTLSPTRAAEKHQPLPAVPDGFTVQRVAGYPLVKHPTMACFDDQGRLYVCESAGTNRRAQQLIDEPLDEIRVLEDTDGDGIFDKAWTFADRLTFPQGCLWYRGAVYTCSPPNVWKLEDTNGDGVCDKRTILISSFGFNGNAASIHGPFAGPDGRLYWCDGRHGHEFFDEEGNVVSKGKAARVFSCLPDGSDIQVLAGGGMDNPVEVDFLETGEVIGTCNLFYGRPRGDTLVHWTEGGVYPRFDQQDCVAEFLSTGDLLPPVYNYGHVAVSGMCRYRSRQFGDDYRDNVFVTEFNTHKVVRSVIERDGASFAHKETTDFVVWDDPDVHPTDVLEDADGSLLVIDTGGWFRIGCPTSQIAKPEIAGAIYRIRRDGAHDIDDPHGLAYADEKN
ncbi:MAG: PVC-type heme-binding CxxCH protein, partial [Maioricimonas sp. JB049]